MANHVERFFKIWNPHSLGRDWNQFQLLKSFLQILGAKQKGLEYYQSVGLSEDLPALQKLESTVKNILLILQIL